MTVCYTLCNERPSKSNGLIYFFFLGKITTYSHVVIMAWLKFKLPNCNLKFDILPTKVWSIFKLFINSLKSHYANVLMDSFYFVFLCFLYFWKRETLKRSKIKYLLLFLIEVSYETLTKLALCKQFKFQTNHIWVSCNLPFFGVIPASMFIGESSVIVILVMLLLEEEI